MWCRNWYFDEKRRSQGGFLQDELQHEVTGMGRSLVTYKVISVLLISGFI